MIRILFITIALISLFCKKEVPLPHYSHSEILRFLIDSIVETGFSEKQAGMLNNLKVWNTSLHDSVYTNTYYLSGNKYYCHLTFYEYIFDSTSLDSIKVRHISHQPFGASNDLLTFLEDIPPYYLVHLDSIKYNDYLLIYKINAPSRDSVYMRTLSSTIKAAMQATNCEQIGPIVSRLNFL